MNTQHTGGRRRSQGAWRLAIALSLAATVQATVAQTVMVYDDQHQPTPQEVAEILFRGASEATKLRGQAPINGRSPFALLEQTPTTKATDASAVSVPVHFDFDSAALTPKAMQQLDVIAEGIRLTEGTVKVVVEGHTDAKGSVAYNENLSYRRAAAVRSYLVNVKKLPVSTLVVEGKGPHKLLDKGDPYNATNRRVQFRAG